VTADWKEVPVIYGLIDPGAHYNFIRINRAYLNESGDALSFAKVADSINFEALSVVVTEFEDGIEKNSIRFERVQGDTIGLQKDTGIFAHTPNYLYRSDYKFKNSDFRTTVQYNLLVINDESGKVYRSTTFSPGFVESKSPIRTNRKSINISDRENNAMAITYIEGPFVKSYDLVVRFRYEEYDSATPSIVRRDSVDWIVFKNRETKRITGYHEQSVITFGELFYQLLASSIEVDPNKRRRPVDMAFIFYGGTEDLFTYINVNKPSIGIVQKKPEFTNIENGLGLFAGRYVNWYDDIEIRSEMKANLAESKITENLNFVID